MTRLARPLAALASVAFAAVAALGPSASSAPAAHRAAQAAPSLELIEQTAVVAPGGSFAMRLRLEGIPEDGVLRLSVHQRVRSRSELAQSMEGSGLRTAMLATATPVDGLAATDDGGRRLVLSLDPADGGLRIPTEGIYPIEVEAQDASGTSLATLVTHLITTPDAGDDAPSLGVATVTELAAPPALQPDGDVLLDAAAVDNIAATVSALAANPEVTATLAVRPETISSLGSSGEPADLALVAAISEATRNRSVLRATYVAVDPDELAAEGLLGELGRQLEAGDAVLDPLASTPLTTTAAVAPEALGGAGLPALAFSGVSRLVVADSQVAPLENGVVSYSLAQPFVVGLPDEEVGDDRTPGDVQGLATDPVVTEHLSGEGSPGLVANRVLTELAFLRLEQPSVPRSVPLLIPSDARPEVVALVLKGLGSGRPFEALTLDEAFEFAAPLLDRGGNQVERELTPVEPASAAGDPGSLRAARSDLETYEGMLVDGTESSQPLAQHLLLASATDLSVAERSDHVAVVESDIGAVTGSVSSPETFTLTLTARDGTVPLTITKGTEEPLRVTVHLRSPKLEFPDGDTLDVVLTEPSQRVDIDVRALSSGAFPLDIDVRSPDNRQSITTSRYTIRSTAISGVGLVLSIGAGAFLVIWWARHWHRTRRSQKLVAAGTHPAHHVRT